MTKTYELVWSDEFDYSGMPDSSKWTFEVGGEGFGNNEDQFYTPANHGNAEVKNDRLVITAKRETYEHRQYTSAKLVTRDIQSWQYGKFEIRAKMPKGKGMWPAIWMMPVSTEGKGWPACGEIDIMENVGKVPDVVHFSLHSEHHNHIIGTQFTHVINVPHIADQFYTYGLEWTEDKIEYYLDGELQYSVKKDEYEMGWPFDKPFYLILNVAVGGNWGGEIDDTVFPQTMEVDYVRVYQ